METHVVGTIIASNWEVMLTSGLRGSNYGEQRVEVKFNVEIKMIPLSNNLITFTDYMGVPIRIHVTFHDYVSSVRMVCGKYDLWPLKCFSIQTYTAATMHIQIMYIA